MKDVCNVCWNVGRVLSGLKLSLPFLDMASGDIVIIDYDNICSECMERLAMKVMTEIDKIRIGVDYED